MNFGVNFGIKSRENRKKNGTEKAEKTKYKTMIIQ